MWPGPSRASRIARALGALTRHINEFDHPEPPPALAEVWGDVDLPTFHDDSAPATNGVTQVEVEDAAVAALEPVAVTEDPWPVPHWSQQDAPCIQTIKWVDRVSGIEYVTVLRADTWAELLPQIAEVSKIARAHRELPAVDSPEAEALATDPSWCKEHGTVMKASQDGKGYFHKSGEKDDGKALWCRGSK